MDPTHYVTLLRQGAVVACPTETLYGLLVDALNPEAVMRICKIKRRSSGTPIAVLLPSMDSTRQVVADFTPLAKHLAEEYWPGPLTLVLRAVGGLPEPLLSKGKIGVRVPGPSPALDLVAAFGGPLTATSANRTGDPPCTTAEQVRAALGQEVDAIIPGQAPGGKPSTVVDATGQTPIVLRAGAVRI